MAETLGIYYPSNPGPAPLVKGWYLVKLSAANSGRNSKYNYVRILIPQQIRKKMGLEPHQLAALKVNENGHLIVKLVNVKIECL